MNAKSTQNLERSLTRYEKDQLEELKFNLTYDRELELSSEVIDEIIDELTIEKSKEEANTKNGTQQLFSTENVLLITSVLWFILGPENSLAQFIQTLMSIFGWGIGIIFILSGLSGAIKINKADAAISYYHPNITTKKIISIVGTISACIAFSYIYAVCYAIVHFTLRSHRKKFITYVLSKKNIKSQ